MSNSGQGRTLIVGLVVISLASVVFIVAQGLSWFRDTSDHLEKNRFAIEAKAKHLARAGLDGCVDGTIGSASQCGAMGVRCILEQNEIADTCYRMVANPDPQFCDGVPSQLNTYGAKEWGAAECKRRGQPANEACITFVSKSVTRYCDSKAIEAKFDQQINSPGSR